jgi:hypothetical protein
LTRVVAVAPSTTAGAVLLDGLVEFMPSTILMLAGGKAGLMGAKV